MDAPTVHRTQNLPITNYYEVVRDTSEPTKNSGCSKVKDKGKFEKEKSATRCPRSESNTESHHYYCKIVRS